MTHPRNPASTPVVFVVCITYVTATGIAALMGSLASLLYSLYLGPPSAIHRDMTSLLSGLGFALGGVSGLVAGALWCRQMIRIQATGTDVSLGRSGAKIGAVVGMGSTVVIHAGLTIASLRVDALGLLFGVGCGAASGAILGRILGPFLRGSSGTPATTGTSSPQVAEP